jgi:osmotically-inducible protein OsmY
MYHRTRGYVMETVGTFKPSGPVDDITLKQRIRSVLGHHVSHPRAMQVEVNHGRALLRGSILAQELDEMLECICAIPGVKSVREELAIYDRQDAIPDLGSETGGRH